PFAMFSYWLLSGFISTGKGSNPNTPRHCILCNP
ncbi:MAG: hypothetical protein AVDCRST_MAG86-4347, partial [uncultured Truepera sp.]